MISELEGVGSLMVKLALDAAALRHQAIAQNIANLHAEGYVRVGVSFEAELAALRRDLASASGERRARAIAAAAPTLVHELERGAGPRTQDIDVEMLALSQNTIHYQALLKAIGRQLAMFADVMNDGRRS
jgi:flagellar basal-body rod protein FlgB